MKITLLLYPLVTLSFINLLALPKMMLYISLISATLVFRTPLSWYFELKSDDAAKKYVSSDAMIDALLDISSTYNRDEPSLTHPSINDRIEKLKD